MHNENREAERVIDFVLGRCPSIEKHIRAKSIPYCKNTLPFFSGVCTHPDIASDDWIGGTFGAKAFQKSDLIPDDFFWMGIERRSNMECVFSLWFKQERKFWFYETLVQYMGGGNDELEAQFDAGLNRALTSWEKGEETIVVHPEWALK